MKRGYIGRLIKSFGILIVFLSVPGVYNYSAAENAYLAIIETLSRNFALLKDGLLEKII